MELNWRPLVETVRSGVIETWAGEPTAGWMYFPQRSVFLGHPRVLGAVRHARNSSEPFLLVGEIGTGKNILVELIARGDGRGVQQPCVDANIEGQWSEPELLEHFFGKGGVVDTNQTSLIVFDLIRNALDKPEFLRRLHELARTRRLLRMDGATLEAPMCRVCVGSTVELDADYAANPASEFGYLYSLLRKHPTVHSVRLSDQPERLATILSEQLAARVLQGRISEQAADALSLVDVRVGGMLSKYSWPSEFVELARFVDDAIANGSWSLAAANLPRRVFVVWSGKDKKLADTFEAQLTSAGIPTFYSPKSLEAGDWMDQIEVQLQFVSHVVICLTEGVFEPDAEGINLREMKRAVDRSETTNWSLLFPVVLDRTTIDVFQKQLQRTSKRGLLRELLKQQFYWVDPESGDGMAKLLSDLRSSMRLASSSLL